MEDVELDELQEQFYQELFLLVENEGKVAALKATELFRSADLSTAEIRQITLLANVPQTALHLSKRQFYSCLKLISAYQAKVPLREELITTNLIALPLPRFNWKDSPPTVNNHVERNGLAATAEKRQWIEVRSPDLIQLSKEPAQTDVATSDQTGTDSEIEPADAKRKGGGSPEAWSTGSESPTPTNSVVTGERPWAKGAMWLCEEQRQLLGTEEESSDRHSSDDDHEIDLETIYQITPEQKEYYMKQFRSIQPDLGLLSGHMAKSFFEKSRIPVDELRHIWQLCDVTRDGALSLEEFIAAMHLVVLRRNNIRIPVVLPACLAQMLVPKPKKEAPEGDLLHLEDDDNKLDNKSEVESTSYKRIISHPDSKPNFVKPPSPKKPPPPLPSSEGSPEPPAGSDKKEWTKFPESPTSSNVSSPGPKPVNFDLQKTTQAIVSDPQILHPVALRVTPEVVDEEANRRKTTDPALVYEAGVIIREAVNHSPGKMQGGPTAGELRPIQRPQPKKVSSKGSIPPPPQREPSLTHADSVDASNTSSSSSYSGKKDPPPLPPPRGGRGHHRSSSLDLKKLKMGSDPPQQPQLQPMASYDGYVEPSSFADFTQFPDTSMDDQPNDKQQASGDFITTIKLDAAGTVPENSIPKPLPRLNLSNSLIGNRTSAFEVYRKPTTSRNSQSPGTVEVVVQQQSCAGAGNSIERYEKRVIAIGDNLRLVRIQPGETMADVLKHLREQNHLLLKICNDLSQELLEVQSRKEELRNKLETTINQKSG